MDTPSYALTYVLNIFSIPGKSGKTKEVVNFKLNFKTWVFNSYISEFHAHG